MKSPIAKKLLFAGLLLVGAFVVAVAVFAALASWGGCSGGRMPMMTDPFNYPPATCEHLPDLIGVVASELTYATFSVVIFSPIWVSGWLIVVALLEIAERNRLKRQKD
ncbi:hypothetical protein [Hasllibacter sp. MH4015]|uniref:hypothetical protein n=1 Tax=Hasllibacter sp. MH4015 TaxID=2854029 RepID=UPI001CD5CDF8|nr:hypothetical protein [Hasllibacter sp. MH4015]